MLHSYPWWHQDRRTYRTCRLEYLRRWWRRRWRGLQGWVNYVSGDSLSPAMSPSMIILWLLPFFTSGCPSTLASSSPALIVSSPYLRALVPGSDLCIPSWYSLASTFGSANRSTSYHLRSLVPWSESFSVFSYTSHNWKLSVFKPQPRHMYMYHENNHRLLKLRSVMHHQYRATMIMKKVDRCNVILLLLLLLLLLPPQPPQPGMLVLMASKPKILPTTKMNYYNGSITIMRLNLLRLDQRCYRFGIILGWGWRKRPIPLMNKIPSVHLLCCHPNPSLVLVMPG